MPQAGSESHATIEQLEGEIQRLERTIRSSARDLGRLRERIRSISRDHVRAEIDEIRDEWEGVHYRWWVGVVAALVVSLLASYSFYASLGWYADQRSLPLSSDWLLDRLPVWNVMPLLSWGWLALHAYAVGVAILYYPRRMPFLLFLLSAYLCVRTVFVFLSPIGAPQGILDMAELDFLFSRVMGEYTFQNEFIFSGHTAIPFLFFLFLETRTQKTVLLVGSLVMALGVLVTHNHYTVDVLSAYLVGYAIFAMSRRLYDSFVQPVFQNAPSR